MIQGYIRRRDLEYGRHVPLLLLRCDQWPVLRAVCRGDGVGVGPVDQRAGRDRRIMQFRVLGQGGQVRRIVQADTVKVCPGLAYGRRQPAPGGFQPDTRLAALPGTEARLIPAPDRPPTIPRLS